MKNKILYLFPQVFMFSLICGFLISCEKEELPITPKDRGGVKTFQVELGNNYEQQIWVDFESGEVVAQQNRYSWDIAFEGSGEHGWVFLNGAKLVRAAYSSQTWENTTSANGLDFKIDVSSGNTDSLAIGDWKSQQKIIVIDKGYTEKGLSAGYTKLQMISTNDGKYTFRYSDLNGANEKTVEVPMDEEYFSIMYSLVDHQILTHQPKINTYDVWFTQYATVLYEGGISPLNYLVNGALINTSKVEAQYLGENNFDEIDEKILQDIQWSKQQDIIGYDWKTYNFNTGIYDVDMKKVYLLKDRKGFYYKLHFIDFYTTSGEKGAPKVEYQKL